MPRRNCLVTGANRGLGLELCRQLLARDEHVVATARDPGQAHELNRLVAEHPGRLHLFPLDVTDPRSEAELVRELPLVLGNGQLDLLINNAGVLHSGERWGHVGADTLEHSFRTNAMGPFLLTQAMVPLLANGSTVAMMSSRLGSMTETTRFGTPGYCISKAALNMATKLLSIALADRGITVIALTPGWVATDMGGESAPITPPQSVAGLLRVIDDAAIEDSGAFFDWQGQPVPW